MVSVDPARREQAPYVVGIAGGSGSGKTTFSAALAAALRDRMPPLSIECISTDSCWKAADDAPQFLSPSSGEMMINANHPDALNTNALLALIAACHADVCIVEGLMTLHIPEVRSVLNLGIFIELDADERALRRMLRDMAGGRRITDPVKIAAYYLECARVGHAQYVEPSRRAADIIIRGDGNFSRASQLLSSVIADGVTQRTAMREAAIAT